MQWMTITSFVPCYAPHVPQHVAVSLFGPLNQILISSAPSAETDFNCLSGLGISRQTGFNLEFPSPRWIACQGYELHPPFFRFCLETYKLLGELSAKTMSFPLPGYFFVETSILLDEWPAKAVEPHPPAWEQAVLITWYSSMEQE